MPKTLTIRVDPETLDRLKRLSETCGGFSIAEIVRTFSYGTVKELMVCGFAQAKAEAAAGRAPGGRPQRWIPLSPPAGRPPGRWRRGRLDERGRPEMPVEAILAGFGGGVLAGCWWEAVLTRWGA